MIEIIPEKVEQAFIYFHSAGTDSGEFEPFLDLVQRLMPHAYIWVGDGNISGSPLMFSNSNYGESDKKYWFMFPMQDACSPKSFDENREAMGASLYSAASFVNHLIDQVKSRFELPAEKIILSGFQHGSSLVLAAAMMRKQDPFKNIILFEPYLLEAFCYKKEIINQETTLICVENEAIREKTYKWIGIHTDLEFIDMGFTVKSLIIKGGDSNLDSKMIEAALKEITRR